MKKKLPEARQVRCHLCEDVRQEINGKLSLLGLYPDDTIIVLGKPASALPPGVVAHLNLAVVIVVTGGAGKFDGILRIVAPGGKALFESPMMPVTIERGRSATAGWKIQGVLFPRFGEYKIEFALDRKRYTFAFRVIDGS
jgi:hypothetical protein